MTACYRCGEPVEAHLETGDPDTALCSACVRVRSDAVIEILNARRLRAARERDARIAWDAHVRHERARFDRAWEFRTALSPTGSAINIQVDAWDLLDEPDRRGRTFAQCMLDLHRWLVANDASFVPKEGLP